MKGRGFQLGIDRRSLLIFLLILFALGLVSCGKTTGLPTARDGLLDLSEGEGARALAEDHLIPLSGEWGFFWEELLTPEEAFHRQPPEMISSPGYWNLEQEGRQTRPAYGFSTWTLTVKLPPARGPRPVYGLRIPRMVTSYELWVDGERAAVNGRVGTSRDESEPYYRDEVYYFTPRKDTVEILCHISNYNYRNGGMWLPMEWGSQRAVSRDRSTAMAVDLFLCGSLLIMALYHLVLFLYRRNDRTALYFGLFSLTVVARIVATSETAATHFIAAFPWEILVKMELLPHSIGGLLFLLYINNLHDELIHRRVIQFFSLTSGVFFLAVLFLPVRWFNHLVVPMEINLVLGILVILTAAGKMVLHHREGWVILTVGLGVFFVTTLNDIFYARQIIRSVYLMPVGLFFFVFSQAVLLAKMFSNSFKRTEFLSREMQSLNQSMKRFVPDEFLRFLKKDSIRDIELGNQILKEMTILFSDIESFTTMSEMMEPQENFNFLNSYLGRMGPVIRSRRGFVDKYIGDAIMALFPEDPAQAVQAALDMHSILKEYNQDREKAGYAPVRFGTGIHTGKMMLGIIGENERLESTVISDSVNLASRIERLTRTYGLDILISENTLNSLDDPSRFHHRMVDVSKVKGKAHRIAVFEVYDHQDEAMIRLKDETKPLMEKAIWAYLRGELTLAVEGAREVLARNPEDRVARLYLDRARREDRIQA